MKEKLAQSLARLAGAESDAKGRFGRPLDLHLQSSSSTTVSRLH